MTTTLPITEARKRIFELAEDVQAPHRVYTLTAAGKPRAVLISADEYAALMETLEVKAAFPTLGKKLAEAKKNLKARKLEDYVPLTELVVKSK